MSFPSTVFSSVRNIHSSIWKRSICTLWRLSFGFEDGGWSDSINFPFSHHTHFAKGCFWDQRWKWRTRDGRWSNIASRGLVALLLAIISKDGKSVFSWIYHLLWFPIKTYELRKSIGQGVFLMSDVLRPCADLFLSCSPQIASSPKFFSWVPSWIFLCLL